MSRIYDITLPCGCMLSSFEESLIPCHSSLSIQTEQILNMEYEKTQEDLDHEMLHKLSWEKHNKGEI